MGGRSRSEVSRHTSSARSREHELQQGVTSPKEAASAWKALCRGDKANGYVASRPRRNFPSERDLALEGCKLDEGSGYDEGALDTEAWWPLTGCPWKGPGATGSEVRCARESASLAAKRLEPWSGARSTTESIRGGTIIGTASPAREAREVSSARVRPRGPHERAMPDRLVH